MSACSLGHRLLVTDGPDLSGVARDATSISELLAAFEVEGFHGQFVAREDARLECLTCRHQVPARHAVVEHLRRLEGASDPDDLLVVLALRCPHCGTPGTLVLGYGPNSTLEDAAVLEQVGEPAPLSPADAVAESGAARPTSTSVDDSERR